VPGKPKHFNVFCGRLFVTFATIVRPLKAKTACRDGAGAVTDENEDSFPASSSRGTLAAAQLAARKAEYLRRCPRYRHAFYWARVWWYVLKPIIDRCLPLGKSFKQRDLTRAFKAARGAYLEMPRSRGGSRGMTVSDDDPITLTKACQLYPRAKLTVDDLVIAGRAA
jgi:hypothetical protein